MKCCEELLDIAAAVIKFMAIILGTAYLVLKKLLAIYKRSTSEKLR
jgi:hypothetical protein